MIDLTFAVVDAQPEPNAAIPTLRFRLRIREASGQPVHAILLRCQLQIEPRRRGRHAPGEQELLRDVFGEPARWRDTLKPLLWIQSSIIAPAFEGEVEIDWPVACTYDLEVTAAKYLHALEGGEAPLLFLFSGTVFAKAENGFRVEPIPWEKEAAFRLPVSLWRDLMERYFPGGGWIRLDRRSMDALQRFRASAGLQSWDAAIEALLSGAEAPAR
jgi:hypothetical protein